MVYDKQLCAGLCGIPHGLKRSVDRERDTPNLARGLHLKSVVRHVVELADIKLPVKPIQNPFQFHTQEIIAYMRLSEINLAWIYDCIW